MKKYQIILFLVISIPVYSQADRLLSKDDLNNDLEYLQNIIFDAHPSKTRYIDSISLHEEFNLNKFDSASSIIELEKRIRTIFSKVGCGHTSIKKTSFSPNKQLMPFEFYANNGSLWIKKVLDDSLTKSLVGNKVLSINGNSATEIIKRMQSFHPSDGYNQTFSYGVINYEDYFNKLYAYYFDTDTIKNLEVLNNDADSILFTINTFEPRKEKRGKYKPDEKICRHNYFRIDSLNSVAFLDIKSFSSSTMILSLEYKKIFTEVERLGITNLVIDLRDNMGGASSNANLLLSYFLDTIYTINYIKPKSKIFKYSTVPSKSIHLLDYLFGPSNFLNNKEKVDNSIIINENQITKSKKHKYKNNIFILTNGLSCSAASYVASVLKQKIGATIIGKETGGGAACCNGAIISTVKLPKSNIKIFIPKYHIDFMLNEDIGRGVTPSITTEYSVDQMIKKCDLESDKVIEMIQEHLHTTMYK